MTTFIANAANLAVTPAGAITADNVQGALEELDTSGKHTIWVPYEAMYASTTNGAAAYSSGDSPTIKGWAFDPTTDESVEFAKAFPKSWNEGTLTARFYWMTAVAESPAHDVIWSIQAKARSDNGPIAGVYGSAISVVDTTLNELALRITAETAAITVGDTPAENDMVFFKVSRDADGGGDTVTNDAILLGVKLIFTTNAVNDD